VKTHSQLYLQCHSTQQLVDVFNSTAQASANKINQLVSNTRSTVSKATTVVKAPKVIPSDVYELIYELTGMTAGALEAWLQYAEFKDLDNRLSTLVNLLDKLINMLANYQSGGQSESAD
jgi:Zn-dependent M32 family carboxypeptidase